jgi:hypothetical protein
MVEFFIEDNGHPVNLIEDKGEFDLPPIRMSITDIEKVLEKTGGRFYIEKSGSMGSKITIALNSAGFYYTATYWLIAEGIFLGFVIKNKKNHELLSRQNMLLSSQALSTYWRWYRERSLLFKKLYLLRLMEKNIAPCPCDGITAYHAAAFAWWAGCDKLIYVGLDLCKDKGAYVQGVPYTKRGHERGYKRQIRALSQIEYPGLKVYNASPYSCDRLPFEKIDLA